MSWRKWSGRWNCWQLRWSATPTTGNPPPARGRSPCACDFARERGRTVAILRVGPAIFGPDEAAAAVAAATRRASAFFAELSDAQLATGVLDAGDRRWTARDVLAHLAGRALGYALVVEFARRGEALDAIDPLEFAQARLDDRRDRVPEEL